MIHTNNILAGGSHTVTVAWKKLDTATQGFRVLTMRLEDNAAGNVTIGLKNKFGWVETTDCYLKTDESWTFGPNAGTIRPSEIYLSGTADDKVGYIGVKVD